MPLVQASSGTVVRTAGQRRLICPPITRPGPRGGGKRPPSEPAGARASKTGTLRTNEKAGQAIASARRIVRLLDAFGQDPDAAAEFAATVPGSLRTIERPDFCRSREDIHQLAQHLIDHGREVTTIPHAVRGPVSTASAVDGRSGERTYLLKYVARHPVFIGVRRLPLQVTVRSQNADWIGAAS